jgi:transcriptional regulator with AAA-type ATPase domain
VDNNPFRLFVHVQHIFIATSVRLILPSMNNKFWREIFDQITSLVMVFRMQVDTAELMFVNKAVNIHLGYTPESFVMESEQAGSLRSSLDQLVHAASDGRKVVVLSDLAGREIPFSVEIRAFHSDAIKEDLSILTLHPYASTTGFAAGDDPIVAESIVMKSVMERLRQLEEVGANMAFVGGKGTGKRLMMDQALRGIIGRGESLWKLDFGDSKKPVYHMDGVQVDFAAMLAFRLRRQTAVIIYELDQMPKNDQTKLMNFVEGQESYIRFVVGSAESPDVLVSGGRLIPELYYKLNVISIVLPPLEMRRADIRPYAERWLGRMCEAVGIDLPMVSDKEWTRLFHHEYKQNYDELNRILMRSLLQSSGEKFHFELEMVETGKQKQRMVALSDARSIVLDHGSTHDQHMREYLRQVMERNGWKIYGGDGAAAQLGMKPTTLQSKLEKYGVEKR